MIEWLILGVLTVVVVQLHIRVKNLEQKADRKIDLTQSVRAESADVAETLIYRHVQQYHQGGR
jgi:hypothetical protein